MNNKKTHWLIFLLVIVLVVILKEMFWLPLLTEEEALEVGVNKYLDFLWMVDGVFNNNDLHYTVNGKEQGEENKIVTCKNNVSKDNKCVISEFESSFKNLFAHNIDYCKVYGGEMSILSISINNNEYTFKNVSSCNQYKMGKNHHLEVNSIERNKIVYRIIFQDESVGKVIGRDYEKFFVLVNENHTWKISKAFYHDACHMDYNIE